MGQKVNPQGLESELLKTGIPSGMLKRISLIIW